MLWGLALACDTTIHNPKYYDPNFEDTVLPLVKQAGGEENFMIASLQDAFGQLGLVDEDKQLLIEALSIREEEWIAKELMPPTQFRITGGDFDALHNQAYRWGNKLAVRLFSFILMDEFEYATFDPPLRERFMVFMGGDSTLNEQRRVWAKAFPKMTPVYSQSSIGVHGAMLDPRLETSIRKYGLSVHSNEPTYDEHLNDIPKIEDPQWMEDPLYTYSGLRGQQMLRFDFIQMGKYYPVGSQIGRLIFLNKSFFDKLRPEEKEELKDRILLYTNDEFLWLFYPWTTPMIFALMQNSIKNFHFIDSGAGNGLLSLAALKLGAPFVHLIDIDEDSLKAAKNVLELNGYKQGKNFQLHAGNLKNETFIQELATVAKGLAIKRSKRLALISNIGTWRNYNVSNQDSLKIAKAAGNIVERVFLGGYNYHFGTCPEHCV